MLHILSEREIRLLVEDRCKKFWNFKVRNLETAIDKLRKRVNKLELKARK